MLVRRENHFKFIGKHVLIYSQKPQPFVSLIGFTLVPYYLWQWSGVGGMFCRRSPVEGHEGSRPQAEPASPISLTLDPYPILVSNDSPLYRLSDGAPQYHPASLSGRPWRHQICSTSPFLDPARKSTGLNLYATPGRLAQATC